MYTIVAIEGIDQIGKSTFIKEIQKRFPRFRIEKPTIGINTLHKDAYPLQNINGIMEIRNIGLFEELLFQVNNHLQNNDNDNFIIRDRFHLSELAYGKVLRCAKFGHILYQSDIMQNEGFETYKKWTRWFEKSLIETGCIVKQIVFVLDDESIPNDDESVSAKDLAYINEEFKTCYEDCTFDKKIIKLHKDSKTGLTNILDFVDIVSNFIFDNGKYLFLVKHNNNIFKQVGTTTEYVATIDKDNLIDIGSKFRFEPNAFMQYLDTNLTKENDLQICIRMTMGTIPSFIGPGNVGETCYVHIGESTFTIGDYNIESGDIIINNCGMSYKDFNDFLYKHMNELLSIEQQNHSSVSNKIVTLIKYIESFL